MEEFEFVTSGIESIAVTIALLAGGAWALYKFCELQAKRHAEAQIRESELRQRETEIEIRQREQEANIGSVIEISIRASQQSLPNDSARYISAILRLRTRERRTHGWSMVRAGLRSLYTPSRSKKMALWISETELRIQYRWVDLLPHHLPA